jgi:DNA (cytosine-5)-methyltransferase 1
MLVPVYSVTQDSTPGVLENLSPTLKIGTGLDMGQPPSVVHGFAVRRITPREAERLQGFPDDWTRVPYRGKPAADGPRYKALGNSMACNVMRWLGTRIQMVEDAVQAAERKAAA